MGWSWNLQILCHAGDDVTTDAYLKRTSELPKLSGAKGNRTPDLLDANESRYQLRHSP